MGLKDGASGATNRPVAVMHPSTPFPLVSVGDRFDDEGWTRIE
jgi:hypothetical protein